MTPFLKNVSSRTLSIIGASVFSLLLVFGAYVTSGPNIFFKVKTAGAESTDALLKAFAAKDSDSDGLPDWQESLYGTDPNNPHSVDPVLTDGEAVAKGLVKPKFSSAATAPKETAQQVLDSIPGPTPDPNSLTAQFSQAFLEAYQQALSANGGQPLSSNDQQQIIDALLANFTTSAQKLVASSYTNISVHTSATESVPTYAASLERVLVKDDVSAGSGDPVALMHSLIIGQDETARSKLKTLGKSYRALATDLAALPVPVALSADHLTLMQSFDTLAKATVMVSNYEQDPVAVLGALSAYQESSNRFEAALNDIAQAILVGGEPASGQPGSLIVSIVRSTQPQP